MGSFERGNLDKATRSLSVMANLPALRVVYLPPSVDRWNLHLDVVAHLSLTSPVAYCII